MKSKITKIMGVALALVLVFSLGAAFMPANTPGGPDEAQAADLSWSTVSIPSTVGNVLVGCDEDLGPVAISPNFATDHTVFAVVNDLVTPAFPLVYKSTNGGHTWTATTSVLGALAGDVGIALEVSPNYALDSTVFVVTQTPLGGPTSGRVYRSVNGNISYGQLGVVNMTAGSNEIITSFDVSPDYDGTGVLAVGIADPDSGPVTGTATLSVQVWGLGAVLSWTAYSAVAYDVSAVKFSPNYAIDSTILVVASLTGAQPLLRDIVGGNWNQISAAGVSIGATAVKDVDTQKGGVATDLIAASIALPQDYNGTVATLRRAYVSIVAEAGNTGLGTSGNVYRVTNVTAGTAIATAAAIQLSGIQYRGTFAAGTLIGGLYTATGGTAADQADVYRTTNPADAVVNWYGVAGAANQPSGLKDATMTDNATCFVKMSADYTTDSTVVVGTIGDDSAFGISTDGAVSFNETGLVDNSPPAGAGGIGNEVAITVITAAALSPNYGTDSTMFLVADNANLANNNSNVWFSTDSGVLWTRAFTANWLAAGVGTVAYTPDFTSGSAAGSVYVGETGGGALNLCVSEDGGNSWSARTAANVTGIQVMAAEGTNLYVGDSASGTVAKSINKGWTFPAAMASATGAATRIASLVVKESTLLAGGGGGTVRRSDDASGSWALVGGAGLPGAVNAFVDFDGTTVYAADAGGGVTGPHIYRSDAGGAWIPLTEPAATVNLYDADGANGLMLAADGTLYLSDPTVVVLAAVAVVGKEGVFRSINPTAAEPTPGTTWQAMINQTAGSNCLGISVASGGSNTVAVISNTVGPAAADTVRLYTDALSAGAAAPKLVAPANGSTLATGQDTRFTIEPITGVTGYQVWWTTSSDFSSSVTSTTWASITGTQSTNQTLIEGVTISWMARANAPFNGPWSEVWTVNTQVTSVVQAPVPTYPGGLAGSTIDVPVNMVFNWGAFKYASGYEFQLGMDGGMTDLVYDMTGADALGNVTSFKPTSTLEYSTTYYWRVRAILGTAAAYSDWSAVVGFTTEAVPVAPTPPVIVEPAPPAPAPTPTGTPAYIWAIIGIGAVLVIVVVVLIVRTRRAV